MEYKIKSNSFGLGSFKGFTLAEVLITLGIIGVVAAMTLPLLIVNYQKKTNSYPVKESLFRVSTSCRNG